MCMLFGFSADKVYQINKCIAEFFSFSVRNPHGWGIATYGKGNNPMIIKEQQPAYLSILANTLTSKSIAARLAIAHIRYATSGKAHYVNTHPFKRVINGTEWVFAHNGSIKNARFIKTNIKCYGQTDSEKVFCYIAEKLEKLPDNIEFEKIIAAIEESIVKFAELGKLNILMSDGVHLYVHTNYKNSLYMYKSTGYICFATQPLNRVFRKHEWIRVPLNRLLVYKDGKEIYKGQQHEFEYFRYKKAVSY